MSPVLVWLTVPHLVLAGRQPARRIRRPGAGAASDRYDPAASRRVGAHPRGGATQGRRDLNPQPPVLETGALPIELLPFRSPRRHAPHPRSEPWAGDSMAVVNHRREVYARERHRVEPGAGAVRSGRPHLGTGSTATGAPVGGWCRERADDVHHPLQELRGHRPATGVPADRRDRRVRDAGRRRQGQGAQGRGPSGHRLRRRRARLPDARVHRRGRGRGVPGGHEPPLHPGRRPARAQEGDRGQDRRATAATRSRPTRCWSPTAASRRSTRPSPPCWTRATRCCCPRRTGRRTRRRSSSPAASRWTSSPVPTRGTS